MGQLSAILFSTWFIVGTGILSGACAAYLSYAFMEYKWPFRRRER